MSENNSTTSIAAPKNPIAQAMAEIRGQIDFDSRNNFAGYNYASGDAIYAACREAIANAGLTLWQDEIDFKFTEIGGKTVCQVVYGFAMSMGIVKPPMTNDGGKPSSRGAGLGKGTDNWERVTVVDSWKGVQTGQALRTYALKYWLRGKFLLATGEPDTDADIGNGGSTPPPPQRQQPKPKPQPKPKAKPQARKEQPPEPPPPQEPPPEQQLAPPEAEKPQPQSQPQKQKSAPKQEQKKKEEGLPPDLAFSFDKITGKYVQSGEGTPVEVATRLCDRLKVDFNPKRITEGKVAAARQVLTANYPQIEKVFEDAGEPGMQQLLELADLWSTAGVEISDYSPIENNGGEK